MVGFMVRQSDIAGMIERPDRFVALDAIGVYEGAIAVDDVKDTTMPPPPSASTSTWTIASSGSVWTCARNRATSWAIARMWSSSRVRASCSILCDRRCCFECFGW
ncbi:MAG: hypothetical protein ACLU37_09500 [Collinsella sp.]